MARHLLTVAFTFLLPLLVGCPQTSIESTLAPGLAGSPSLPGATASGSSRSASKILAAPEPSLVAASELAQNPSAFVAKRIKLHLRNVLVRLGGGGDECKHQVISGTRLEHNNNLIIVCLNDATAQKWQSAGLDERMQYIVSVAGTFREITNRASIPEYGLFVDSLAFNAEYGASDKEPELVPSSELQLPRPVRASDAQRVALFPQDFTNRSVRFPAVIRREEMRRGADGSALVPAEHLDLELPDTIARRLFDHSDSVAHVEIIGALVSPPQPTGRVTVRVQELRFQF